MKMFFVIVKELIFVYLDGRPKNLPIIQPATFQQLLNDGIFDINLN
jgi:hypothetical protein